MDNGKTFIRDIYIYGLHVCMDEIDLKSKVSNIEMSVWLGLRFAYQ